MRLLHYAIPWRRKAYYSPLLSISEDMEPTYAYTDKPKPGALAPGNIMRQVFRFFTRRLVSLLAAAVILYLISGHLVNLATIKVRPSLTRRLAASPPSFDLGLTNA